VPIDGSVTVTLTLDLAGDAPNDAVIDYRVHYVGADGLRRPKVFKLTRRRLEPGRPTVVRRHRFEHASIRRILPGRHVIEVQVTAGSSAAQRWREWLISAGDAPARGALRHPRRGRAGASVQRFCLLGEVEP